MTDERLFDRIAVDPEICSGRPHIRGTRVCIMVILDALTHGLSPEEVLEHYPALEADDLRAAVAYAYRMAECNGGLVWLGRQLPTDPFRPS